MPTALVEQLALVGPEDKIRHDAEAWRDSIVTTILVGGDDYRRFCHPAIQARPSRRSAGPRGSRHAATLVS